ncbi:MAG TPA: response regulator [Candidatus Deferrimicrobiaceae bacterium]
MPRTRILLIDDEPIIRTLFKAFLADEEYEVTEAGNGQEGMAAFRAERPDLVVCAGASAASAARG